MDDRGFIIGETVRLRVRVSQAGTRNPATPGGGVSLLRLAVNGTHVNLPTDVSFITVADGLYELALDSASMAAGTWWWLAKIDGGVLGVSLDEDTFILREPITVP